MYGLASRVDHVVIETGDEEGLFSFFHDQLGLPLAWPLSNWAGISEAGVGVGNCNIGCNHLMDPGRDPAPALTMIALQPAVPIDALVVELQHRGVGPTHRMESNALDLPDEEPFEPWRRGWTLVLAAGGPSFPMAFFCQYHHDMTARAATETTSFAARGGGPFAITGLQAISVSTPDLPAAERAWTALLGDDALVADGVLALPGSPQLRLREGEPATGLIFGVRSLDVGESAAKKRGLSCVRRDQIRLDPNQALGLDIAFEQDRT